MRVCVRVCVLGGGGVIRGRAENSKRGGCEELKKKLEKRQRGEGVGKQEKQAANVDGRKKAGTVPSIHK